MKRELAFAVALCALLAPRTASSQQEPTPMVHVIYYRCDQSKESRADEIVRQTLAPIFDVHMQSGHISAWGWLSHRAGGNWRRVLYWIAPGRDALLDATDRITEDLNRDHAAAALELASVCPSHDDYIWRSVAGSEGPVDVGLDRPVASLSTYYECDATGEARADTLVMEAFAPIFARHVEADHIDGWTWLAHDVGGKLRRLAVFDGPNHKAILNARDMIIADLAGEAADAIGEFSRICSTHVDYLWNIAISRP